MAGKILNRREMRKQADQAEKTEETTTGESEANGKARKAPKAKKGTAVPKVRKPRAKKIKIKPRMRVRWGIFNASLKQVAIFDYNQKVAADDKLAELLTRNSGLFYLQPVKEEILEPDAAIESAAV
jgi:hypothetical protein